MYEKNRENSFYTMPPQFYATMLDEWNNMLRPMLVYRDASKFTLPIGLNTLLTPYGNNYDLLIAGSCFSILPVFIVFLIFKKYFILKA